MTKKNLFGIAAIGIAIITAALFLTCEQPASDGEAKGNNAVEAGLSAEQQAAAFMADSTVAAVLNLTLETVERDDKPAVKTALAAYNTLSDEAKALLTEEKTKLDTLRAAIPPLWTDATVSGAGYQGSYTHYLRDIAYGGPAGSEKYVVVGDTYPQMDSSAIEYSANGKDWTPVPAYTDSSDAEIRIDNEAHVWGIAYGNGKFVAVGGGVILYSGDGVAWHRAALSEEVRRGYYGLNNLVLKYIAYGGPAGSEKFIAVGHSGEIIRSEDGVNWEKVPNTPIWGNLTYSVKYTGGKFITTGTNGKTTWSNNGVDWTLVSGPGTPERIGDIAFINGKFAVSVNDLTDVHNIKYSVFLMDDIATWSSASQLGLYDVFGEFDDVSNSGMIVFESGGPAGKEKLITTAIRGRYAFSSDGTTWSRFTEGADGYTAFSKIKYTGGKYFAFLGLYNDTTPSLIYTTPEELD